MARIRCVLGPKTDCEFYGGNGWCERSCIEAVTSWEDNAPVICKMRKRQPSWDYLTQPPDADWDGLLDFRCVPSYKKRGTEEEGMMLNCLLGVDGRKGCMNYCPETPFTGKCSLDYVSGHRIDGTTSCDQYKEKEELRHCDVCNKGTVSHGISNDGRDDVLCDLCYAIYCRLTNCNSHSDIMNMLKALVARARENN